MHFLENFPGQYRSMKYKITERLKTPRRHKIILHTFTKDNDYIKAKHILFNPKKNHKQAKKQHCSTLMGKSTRNNKIKTTWNVIKKETRKVHSVEQVPTLL